MPVGPITLGAVLLFGEKILASIKTLFGFKESLAKAKVERRARMGVLFEAVAVCLEDTANQIRGGSYPSGRCQELLSYAVELPGVVAEEVGESKSQEVGDALKASHEVERLFSVRSTPEGDEQLNKLDEAAGLLRALSNLVRV